MGLSLIFHQIGSLQLQNQALLIQALTIQTYIPRLQYQTQPKSTIPSHPNAFRKQLETLTPLNAHQIIYNDAPSLPQKMENQPAK